MRSASLPGLCHRSAGTVPAVWPAPQPCWSHICECVRPLTFVPLFSLSPALSAAASRHLSFSPLSPFSIHVCAPLSCSYRLALLPFLGVGSQEGGGLGLPSEGVPPGGVGCQAPGPVTGLGGLREWAWEWPPGRRHPAAAVQSSPPASSHCTRPNGQRSPRHPKSCCVWTLSPAGRLAPLLGSGLSLLLQRSTSASV